MNRKMHLPLPQKGLVEYPTTVMHIHLSKSMESTIQRFKNSKEERDAYVDAEVIIGFSHQIRKLRSDRGWTQKDLAEKMGTTQSTVSRIEDADNESYSIQTILKLCHAFDVGLNLAFSSIINMYQEKLNPELKRIDAFEDEVKLVSYRQTDDIQRVICIDVSERLDNLININLSTSSMPYGLSRYGTNIKSAEEFIMEINYDN